ncbi:phage protease [Methylomagnum ishizawai]|nr:phage protease [Methylomagnum ishizawai]
MATQSRKTLIAALTVAVPAPDGSMQIFPAGQFDAPRGSLLGAGPWRLDAAAATALIARIGALSNDILIDYDHESIQEDAKPPILAAGWLARDGFEWREGEGLFHRSPTWTPVAAQRIADGELRYVSAVFPYDRATGHPLDIISVAVTNSPGLDGMQPLVAALSARLAETPALNPNPDTSMDELLEQLRWMLSLPLSSGATEILAELQKLIDKIKGDGEVAATGRANLLVYIAALKALVGEQTAALAALKTGQPDPTRYAPVALVQELQAEVRALRQEGTAAEAGRVLEAALSVGKCATPAKRTYANSLAGLDTEGKAIPGAVPNVAALRAYLDSEEPLAALGGSQTGGKQPEGDGQPGQPNATELAACRMMGLSPEQYKVGKADLAKRFGGVK